MRNALTIAAVLLLLISLVTGVTWAFSLSVFVYPINDSLVSIESDAPWLGRWALLFLAAAMVLLLCATKIPAAHSPQGFCSTCNYDLTGNTTGICPECGSTITTTTTTTAHPPRA